ncbi:MAG: hypothetical protein NC319_04710 [Butyricicoccus sp.]|nr:hypothetical protein [Butyricicoccus sp.]
MIKRKPDKPDEPAPDESATETSSDITTYAGTADAGFPELPVGDILCVYIGVHPDERTAGISKGSLDGSALLDPAVYDVLVINRAARNLNGAAPEKNYGPTGLNDDPVPKNITTL